MVEKIEAVFNYNVILVIDTEYLTKLYLLLKQRSRFYSNSQTVYFINSDRYGFTDSPQLTAISIQQTMYVDAPWLI